MRPVRLLCLVLWTVSSVGLCVDCRPKVRPEYIHDADGRIVIYHGVGVSNTSKSSPDHLPWQTREDFARLRGWGFNLVRYLVFWDAIEPVQGQYDDAYIASTVERLRWLDELGIDVIVDFHQDLYARRYSGNGFPDWTVNDGGHTFTLQQPWNLNYLEPAVAASYDHFWNSASLKTQYVAAMEQMMAAVDGLPNVIGVDVMNEPWPWSAPQFEETCLTAMYEDIQAMMTRNGFGSRLGFEPVIFTSAGLPTQLRFRPAVPNVYCPHYYDPLCHEGVAYSDLGQGWMRLGVEGKVAEAVQFGSPLIFGEFGISSTVEGYDRYLDDFLNLMDEYHLGWAYWAYDRVTHSAFGILDENGQPEVKLPLLTRVYPQRIAGRNPDWRREARSFELQFDPIATDAPTVVFVPAGLENVRVAVNGTAVQWDAAEQYFLHRNGGATARQVIRIEWE